MKQSDILSFAINGVQMQITKLQSEVIKINRELAGLNENLKELQEIDRCQANEKPAVYRPPGFVAEPLLKSDKL